MNWAITEVRQPLTSKLWCWVALVIGKLCTSLLQGTSATPDGQVRTPGPPLYKDRALLCPPFLHFRGSRDQQLGGHELIPDNGAMRNTGLSGHGTLLGHFWRDNPVKDRMVGQVRTQTWIQILSLNIWPWVIYLILSLSFIHKMGTIITPISYGYYEVSVG